MRTDAADMALDALALVENSVEDNPVNRAALLKAVDAGELVVGLVTLAGSLRASLAHAWGVTVPELDELLRAQFLTNAVSLDFGGTL